MSDALRLMIPRQDELEFYQQMLEDPATMAYNAPWFPPDGCIPFPESEWADWYAEWFGREPERFFAYLQRESDGAYVGNVDYHRDPGHDWWDMGIVIHAPERGKGYGKAGLELLLEHAFHVGGVRRMHNVFEETRGAAYHIHLSLGFREIGWEGGEVHLLLTREEYDARRNCPVT